MWNNETVNSEMYVDWVLVRNCNETDPSVTLGSELIIIKPGEAKLIDEVNGCLINITSNALGYFSGQRSRSNLVIDNIWGNLTALYYYNFTMLNISMIKDNSIINSLSIRIYYDENEVKDEENLYLLHYIAEAEPIQVWEKVDVEINRDLNYIEFNITELSVFCLAVIKTVNNPEDNQNPFLVFLSENLILIVILSTIGVTIPSIYIITKKRKENKKIQEKLKGNINKKYINKSIDKTGQSDFAEKAKEKRNTLIQNDIRRENEETKKQEQLSAKKDLKGIPLTYTNPKSQKVPKKVTLLQPKKKTSIIPTITPLSEDEKKKISEEIETTEKEMEISKNIDICQVHKGKIEGMSYICPKCQQKYCLKCASALARNKEACWVCETPIKIEFKENRDIQVEVPIEEENVVLLTNQEKLLEITRSEAVLERILEADNINITTIEKDFLE